MSGGGVAIGVVSRSNATIPGSYPLPISPVNHCRWVKVRGPKSEIELPLMPAKPKSIRFNDLEGVLAEVKMEDWKS